jgi:hypothetical protein
MKINEYRISMRTNQNHADYVHNLLAAECINMIYCEEEEDESEESFEVEKITSVVHSELG